MDTKIDLSSFFVSFEKEVLSFLLEQHFELTIVGGGARDFLIFKKKSFDLDIEVRNIDAGKLQAVLTEFSRGHPDYKFTELPFGIIRIAESSGHTVEFSLPRTEEIIDPFHHHYFKAHLDANLSFEKAFLRRDFTVNAIGIKIENLSEGTIVDPYNGLEDAQKKILRPVSSDLFPLDPVRFLRAYRFKEKFQYEFDESLKKILASMPLHKLSFHYFKDEWKKAGSLMFGLELISSMGKNSELPAFFEKVSRLVSLLEDLKNHPEHKDLLTPLNFRKLGQVFYYTSRMDFKDLEEEKQEVEFSRVMFELNEKEMKALLNIRALWKVKSFTLNDFGLNENYHFYLKTLQKRLVYLVSHEEFLKTFFPENFLFEWEVYKHSSEIEKNLTVSLKEEREKVSASWRSLYTLHLALARSTLK